MQSCNRFTAVRVASLPRAARVPPPMRIHRPPSHAESGGLKRCPSVSPRSRAGQEATRGALENLNMLPTWEKCRRSPKAFDNSTMARSPVQ